MGVVYKLKQEIIDFIILKKKEAPSLSCRRLVDIIRSDFRLEVSKSSVNAVIKEFELSSPVGRRATYKAPKNFLIPQDKKEKLLQNVTPFLSEMPATQKLSVDEIKDAEPVVFPERFFESQPVLETVSDPGQEQTPVFPSQEQEVSVEAEELRDSFLDPLASSLSQETEPVVESQEDSLDVALPTTHLLPDPMARLSVSEGQRIDIALSKVNPSQEPGYEPFWGEEKGFKYDNIGLLVAGAMLWDMQRRPLLGEILAGELRDPIEFEQLPGLELLALHQLFLKEPTSRLFEDGGKFLFDCFGLERHRAEEWVADIATLKDEKKFCLTTVSLMETTGTLVASVRVALKNGTVFYFDPFFTSCTTEFSGAQNGLVPLLSATERVGDMFISNVCPIVLRNRPFPLSDVRLGAFFELFDGKGAIAELALLDASGEKCVVFQDIPCMPRKFIMGAHLSSGEGAMVDTETIGNSLEYFDPFGGQRVSYFEGKIAKVSFGEGLRTIMIGPRGGRKDFALLSNMKERTKDIFFQYALLGNDLIGEIKHEDMVQNSDFMGKSHIIGHENTIITPQYKGLISLKGYLKNMICGLILNHESVLDDARFLELFMVSGYYKRTHRGVFIRFASIKEGAIQDMIERSVFLLNRRAIFSYDGQRVHFSFEKA
ncbi:MAG: hypothetical protein HQL21_04385 [Candidatus Omnitrophica bacterium]|nr:hypothetical protein [Candidatus Omnitrophota bacterium]